MVSFMEKYSKKRGRKRVSDEVLGVKIQEKLNRIDGKLVYIERGCDAIGKRRLLPDGSKPVYDIVVWTCSKGHRCNHRLASFLRLVNLSCRWCRKENKPVYTIERLREEARARGAEMISVGYTNFRTPLMWKCSCGNTFTAKASVLRYKSIKCPTCRGIGAGRHRYNLIRLAEALKMAEGRGGLCLSAEYVSSYKRMRWCCDSGHEWEASFNSIKFGSWCPVCARLNRCKQQ